MAAYQISLRARQDLDGIYDYIAFRNHNPAAADRLLDLIFEKFTTLAQSPLSGQPCDELRPGLRRFPVRKYVIYYSMDDEGIWIERVLHGARDPDLQFGGNGG